MTYPDFIGVVTHLVSASVWVDVFIPAKVEPVYVSQHHTIALLKSLFAPTLHVLNVKIFCCTLLYDAVGTTHKNT